jgi:cytochrome P450
LLNIFPTLFAREALKARKVLVDAFDQYFANRGQECGSSFVQTHYQHKIDQGVTGIDVARFELGGMVAILSNTVPAAFWVLYHTVSDVVVLEECRRDVMACCRVNDDYYTLDITQVKASCPLLLSILQESLRYHGIGTSVRVVMQDHMLDGRYLLKKDGIVMIPGPVQHTSKEAYGENVDEFDHKRFMRSPGRRRLNPLAFRGFGGGSTLCPGRHFATTEVLTFVALMIVRMDFEPVRGEWVCPKTDKAGMAGTIAPPNLDDDVEVLLSPATGHLAGKMWRVVVSGSDEGVPFAVEDEKHG